jgi:hypothetical protein
MGSYVALKKDENLFTMILEIIAGHYLIFGMLFLQLRGKAGYE